MGQHNVQNYLCLYYSKGFIVQYFKLHVMPLEELNGNEMRWARLTLWCDHHLTQDAGWPHHGLLD